jgi:hypothetical protein
MFTLCILSFDAAPDGIGVGSDLVRINRQFDFNVASPCATVTRHSEPASIESNSSDKNGEDD